MTVSVARHVVRSSMHEVGVARDTISDIEIALTEACTNVLKHSGPGDRYEVSLSVEPATAVLRVVDRGHGFDVERLAGLDAAATDEDGRGLSLMQALVDTVKFTSVPEDGTVVRMEKELTFDSDAPAARLLQLPPD